MRRITVATMLAAALLVPGMRAVSALQDHPSPTRTYVVEAGDTLWTIASRIDPSADRRVIVDEVMNLNEMSSPTLYPGQRLKLPGLKFPA
jgi:LysM repeat protein